MSEVEEMAQERECSRKEDLAPIETQKNKKLATINLREGRISSTKL